MPEDKKGLDFSLPNGSYGQPSKKGHCCIWNCLVNAIVIIVCFAVCRGTCPRGNGCPKGEVTGNALSAEALQEYAQKLEKQGLAHEAPAAWRVYLAAAKPQAEKAAKIWYRIGMIQQDGHLYEEALASFCKSDMLCRLPDLEPEITRRSQQCLEALGKVVAMRRNLEDRTAMQGAAKSDEQPIVEIGDWKISRSEAEKMIEQNLDSMFAGSGMSREDMTARKKEMLKQATEPQRLMQFLGQMVSQELLYREAMEEKLNEDLAVREEILQSERRVLMSAYAKKAFGGLDASQSEVNDFYQAHLDEFTDNAAVKLAHIEFATEDKANAALKSLAEKQDFAELAKLLSVDKNTADSGGELYGWIEASDSVDWRREAAKEILEGGGKIAKDDVVPKAFKGEKTWHVVKVLDKRDKTVRDIKDEAVARAAKARLLERKTEEKQTQVFAELSRKYNVVWHQQK